MEPRILNPYRFARRNAVLEGTVNYSDLTRLIPSLADVAGAFQVNLKFSYDDAGRCLMVGNLSGELQLACQRCLGAINWPLDLSIQLFIISNESKANRTPADFEPILTEDDTIQLYEVLESEIILSLPAFPAHLEENCSDK